MFKKLLSSGKKIIALCISLGLLIFITSLAFGLFMLGLKVLIFILGFSIVASIIRRVLRFFGW